MKLAFCLFKYFPFGGLQRDFLRIAKECLSRGHKIDVYTMHWEGEKEPNFNIHVEPIKGWQNHTRVKTFINAITPRLKHYDGVIGFNKMPGLDIYYAADTCYQAKAHTQKKWWYRWTERYKQWVAYEAAVFKSSPTDILLISSQQQAEFIKYYGTSLNKFHLLPPGITKDRIYPENGEQIRNQVRKEFHIKDNEFLLLMVGSGFKTKGLDRVLLGYANLPDKIKKITKVFVIGKDRPQIFQKQAMKLGIQENIYFLGGRHDVPQFLLAADLLLHPAYNENTGTVLLEALASGLPIITTDVCGYASYIKEANAGEVLTSPFDVNKFSQSIAKALVTDQRQHWHKNAIAFAKEADIYSMPMRAADCIEKLLISRCQ